MRVGNTIFFKSCPKIIATGTVCGPKESAGIAGQYVDIPAHDDMFKEKTFERAERKMLETSVNKAMEKVNFTNKDIDIFFSGDLLNQIISASFTARALQVPYLGIYSACSTMSEGLLLAGMSIDGGFANNIAIATGSHFSSAERQYRFPLELGNTRPPQSQWTVTGAGCAIVSSKGETDAPVITSGTIGRVIDYGVSDANNMGAAMAPAAADTILQYCKDTNTVASSFDLVLTGDLGVLGSRIVKDLVADGGQDIFKNHVDCGEIIYKVIEDEFQGGSGAGCSAVILNSYIMDKLRKKEINKILFIATGALLSTVSSGQGETIPCVAHAVTIENRG